jgi:hypothetical protein
MHTYTIGAAAAAFFVRDVSGGADTTLPSHSLDELVETAAVYSVFQESKHEESSRHLPHAAGASEDQGTFALWIIHRHTPADVCRVDSDRRQVSWLADRRLILPSRRHVAASGARG